MTVRCIECGDEIGAERADLGYAYCTKKRCQDKHRQGPAVTAVAVNKSGDSFRVADSDEIDRRAAAGEFGTKNTGLGLDHRHDTSQSRSAGRAAPTRPAPARRAPVVPRRRGWTPAQENIVRLYAEMGLSPRQIAERARQNTPRLAVTESLAVKILANPRRR
jgi:hypothetical protein